MSTVPSRLDMKKYAIIVAGGKGVRMGAEIPKQFLELGGKPVLMHSIEKFHAFDDTISIIVVLPFFQIDFWKELCSRHQFKIEHSVVQGGEERYHSVGNGLKRIEHDDSLVAIHDGVRPSVSIDTIRRCYEQAEARGNAIPVIPVVDSVRSVMASGNRQADRASLRLVQTPQTFKTSLIKHAFNQGWRKEFTDDASVLEAAGYEIYLVDGNIENTKITSPFDLLVAERMMI